MSVPEPFDWESLIAGRWLNRIGLLLTALAVAYFLKLAIDNDWIGPTGQIALGVVFGTALLASGPWFIARGFSYFADGLTGLGGAVLYLSLWAGHGYYHLFPTTAAFVGMIIVTVAMLAIALGRPSQPVAVMALVGGFLTPVLVSTGRDAQLELFSYLALLNLTLLPIARKRDWRFIEVPAFLFTQAYFWGWAFNFYTPARLVRTIGFSTFFFFEFAAVPVLRGRRDGRVFPEQTLLMLANASAVVAALCYTMWQPHRWALTLAVLLLAAAHVGIARTIPRRNDGPSQARLLFAGLALMLLTAVIPIRLENRWMTMAWSVEAAVLMWTGLEYRSAQLRGLAFVLFTIVILRTVLLPLPYFQFLLNERFFAELTVIASLGFSVWHARRRREVLGDGEATFVNVLGVAANGLAVWALTTEVQTYFRGDPLTGLRPAASRLAEGLAISLLWAAYAGGLMVYGVKRDFAPVRWQGLALLGLTTAKVFLVDLASLTGFYRVGSSFALGVMLLVVSFLYQRNLVARKARSES